VYECSRPLRSLEHSTKIPDASSHATRLDECSPVPCNEDRSSTAAVDLQSVFDANGGRVLLWLSSASPMLGCLSHRQVWDATPMRCRCPRASVVGSKGRSPLLPQGAQVGQADTCAYAYEPYRFNTQQSLQHSAPPVSQPTRHNIEQRDAGSQGVLLRSEEEPVLFRQTSVCGHLDYPNVNLHTTLICYVSL
jgi:hypothetical protein